MTERIYKIVVNLSEFLEDGSAAAHFPYYQTEDARRKTLNVWKIFGNG